MPAQNLHVCLHDFFQVIQVSIFYTVEFHNNNIKQIPYL